MFYCPECQRTKNVNAILILPTQPKEAAYLCLECGGRFRQGAWETCDQIQERLFKEERAHEAKRAEAACFGTKETYPGAGLEVINPRNERNGR